MRNQQVLNCTFSKWYHNFKDDTFKSEIITLPSAFVDYLSSDGIVLPDTEDVQYSNTLNSYSDDSGDDSWDNDAPSRASMFPELKEQVDSAIEKLGGYVFPKLNWSSPRDAAWISHSQSLKCSSFNEICLLLKSSDFVSHDLQYACELCPQLDDNSSEQQGQQHIELVLREWREVVQGMEFRCFVKQNKLIRITQRYLTFFSYLHEKKENIFALLRQFFNRTIKEKFADVDFVFDVFINDQNRVYVIDFNPYGEITDCGLLSWDELHQVDHDAVDVNNEEEVLVLVEQDMTMQPSHHLNSYPKDMIDLCRGEDVNKMIDFLNLKELVYRPTGDDDDDNGSGDTGRT